MFFDIEQNPNCESVQRVYMVSGESTPVSQVRIFRPDFGKDGQWCAVCAVEAPGIFAQAFVQKVEDSGEGTALLISGGNWGIRFKRTDIDGPWDLKDPKQWGEPYLVYGDANDIK